MIENKRPGVFLKKRSSIEIYLVGGAVRDLLRGSVPQDRDYLVVGASSEELVKLGFKQVGKDFSVFIDPQTRQEFALPRGISPSATFSQTPSRTHSEREMLLEDLRRRDLTINAMALPNSAQELSNLIDPFGGKEDLKNKILRHVSEHFKDDPIRILRLARFRAQWPDFTTHPKTIEFIRSFVSELSSQKLIGERVFAELEKALLTTRPEIFFQELDQLGALSVFFPELKALQGVPQTARYHPEGDAWTHTVLVLKKATQESPLLAVRFAALVHDLGKALTPHDEWPRHVAHEFRGLPVVSQFCDRLKVPWDLKELALKVVEYHLRAHRSLEMRAEKILDLLMATEALRRPDFFNHFLIVCRCDQLGKLQEQYPPEDFLKKCAQLLLTPEAREQVQSLGQRGLTGEELAKKIRQFRIKILRPFIKDFKAQGKVV